jgi:hypothetical protein
MNLTWTKEKPKEAGWYATLQDTGSRWFRNWTITEMDGDDNVVWWLGPIPTPGWDQVEPKSKILPIPPEVQAVYREAFGKQG